MAIARKLGYVQPEVAIDLAFSGLRAMSSNRFGPKFAPLRYVPPIELTEDSGLEQPERINSDRRLDSIRRELLAELERADSSERSFELLDRPDRLLAEYQTARRKSHLGRILAVATRLRESVDRVVVIGCGGFDLGARALFGACCHPYHNELGRGDRGGRPRIYFVGTDFDTDTTQGLLDLLSHERSARTVDDRWGLIVISDDSDAYSLSGEFAAMQILLRALKKSCGGDPEAVAQVIVPVCGSRGWLWELATDLGCANSFADLDGAGGRFSVFTAAGLLPAAVMGLDLFQLLRGAAAMNERFRSAPPGDNPPLDYVAALHLLGRKYDQAGHMLTTWGKGLEATRAWHDQFRPSSFAMPLGHCETLITNLIVDEARRDRLTLGEEAVDQSEQIKLTRPTYAEMMEATIQAATQSRLAEGCSTASIRLPHLDECSLGQFFQMIMLAAALEDRIMSLNLNKEL